MRTEDWIKVLDETKRYTHKRIIRREWEYEKFLVRSYMAEEDIDDYDEAERELAERGEIFGQLELIVDDVHFKSKVTGEYFCRGSGKVEKVGEDSEIIKYEEITKRGLEEFKKSKLKPYRVVFSDVEVLDYLDVMYKRLFMGPVIESYDLGTETLGALMSGVKTLFFGYIPVHKARKSWE